MVIREAPQQINDLVRFGVKFDLEGGELALTREGGHSHRRIVHALGDATGHEVMRALIARARNTPNVTLRGETFTLDLLTHEGRCVGAIVWRQGVGVSLIWARQVILASGGCGMVYRETTNPPVATGDGMAAAWRAGAELRDMEFMQFHPTVLYVAGSARFLISEAVRGEGAYLRDVNGERFMLTEDPRHELAPRDVVSQAIFRCMERTQHPNVYLDLSHIPPARVAERFPGISQVCRSFGLDISKDLIPVRPGAHYMVGGVTVDMQGRTRCPGCGRRKVTSSGLHGANRLGIQLAHRGTGLRDLVRSRCCCVGEDESRKSCVAALSFQTTKPTTGESLDVTDLTNSLRSLMVRNMGIVRDRRRMIEAKRDVAFWCRYVLTREFDSRVGWELQNLMTVARLMIDSALTREESRGTHFRSDFPVRDDLVWNKHVASPGSTTA